MFPELTSIPTNKTKNNVYIQTKFNKIIRKYIKLIHLRTKKLLKKYPKQRNGEKAKELRNLRKRDTIKIKADREAKKLIKSKEKKKGNKDEFRQRENEDEIETMHGGSRDEIERK